MNMLYMLDKKTPVKVEETQGGLVVWEQWFAKADRTVKETMIGDVRISTGFLVIDHGFFHDAKKPILFETMVFGGELDEEQDRCCTWEEAEIMHEKMCHAQATSNKTGKTLKLLEFSQPKKIGEINPSGDIKEEE